MSKDKIKRGDQVFVEGVPDVLTVLELIQKDGRCFIVARHGKITVTVTLDRIEEHHPVCDRNENRLPVDVSAFRSLLTKPRKAGGPGDGKSPVQRFRERYFIPPSQGGNNRSLTCGDEVAETLTAQIKVHGSLYRCPLLTQCGLDPLALQDTYGHLRPGTQRMVISNIVRGILRKLAK